MNHQRLLCSLWGGMVAIALQPFNVAAQDSAHLQIPAQLHPDLPPTLVVLHGTADDHLVAIHSIEIYTPADAPTPQQRITDLDTQFPDRATAGLIVEDLNFDGYGDLRLPEFLPASPNIPYLYWLYNPETAQFERNRELEIITSPVVDAEQQIITSMSRENAITHVISDYQMQGDRPQLIQERREIYDPSGQMRVIVKAWQNGEFVIVSDRLEPVPPPPSSP